MEDFVLSLIYLGGSAVYPGFWKGMFWPYYLGKRLALFAMNEPCPRHSQQKGE